MKKGDIIKVGTIDGNYVIGWEFDCDECEDSVGVQLGSDGSTWMVAGWTLEQLARIEETERLFPSPEG